MEAAYRPAGDGDEQTGENGPHRAGLPAAARVGQAVPEFGQHRPLHQQARQEGRRHEEQRNGEERIHLADDAVDGEHRGQHVVGEDDQNPPHRGAAEVSENEGRAVDKHHADHHQQEHREHQHRQPHPPPEVVPDEFGQPCPVVAQRQHAREVVVDGPREDAAQHNPEERGSSEFSTHDGTKDRTQPGNVEELNHKDLPGGKRHEIHTVLFREGGCLSIDFNAKGTLNERTVDKIAGYQSQQATDEGNHRSNCKSRMAGNTLASHSLYINLLS